MYRPTSLITGIFLFFIAGGQLIRAMGNVDVMVAGLQIPVWISWILAPALALLAYLLLKERLRKD